MTPEQSAGAARPAVVTLGGAFAEDPKTLRRARELGLTGWAFYLAGRAGALGDVSPDTVVAALGFVSPEAVHDGWEAARRVTPPFRIARFHLQECCRWGDERLGDLPRIGRLVELAERVVLAVDAAGLALFAAWRAMPVPRHGPGAHAAVLLHLLREHHSGVHLIAARASGLTPLEALIAGPDGKAGAMAHGWQPPYPPAAPLMRRRAWADSLADRIVGEAYRALEPGERVELVELLESALATAGSIPGMASSSG